ncbi:MAG: Sec-independent protein translocase protein TatB [Pseudomonadota bacterium]
MLDMGWMEILVIGVIALIVVGPKDLPRMLRTLGQYTGKLRGMAREFQRSMDDAAREADMAELKDIKGALDDVRSIQNDTSRGISKALSDAEKAIDKEVDLKEPAEKPEKLEPTQPLPTPTSPTPKPAPVATTPQKTSEPSAADTVPEQTAEGAPPKTGTDA